jgi:hypothetical protein
MARCLVTFAMKCSGHDFICWPFDLHVSTLIGCGIDLACGKVYISLGMMEWNYLIKTSFYKIYHDPMVAILPPWPLCRTLPSTLLFRETATSAHFPLF